VRFVKSEQGRRLGHRAWSEEATERLGDGEKEMRAEGEVKLQ